MTAPVLLDFVRKLSPAIMSGACIAVLYLSLDLPRQIEVLILGVAPFLITFLIEIGGFYLRGQSDAANISTMVKVVEDMEARGLINSKQKRSIINTLLDGYLSPESRLEVEVGESIRRHGDSLRTNLRK